MKKNMETRVERNDHCHKENEGDTECFNLRNRDENHLQTVVERGQDSRGRDKIIRR